jgi:GT2 family glycosyltransferase/SAM-dependent methyltransferase
MVDKSTINSVAYWDGRFTEDWDACQGPAQSRFFAKLAIEHLPRWLLDSLRRETLTLADWGCAQGDGTDVWANYIAAQQITGVDFSAVAIDHAARRYPAIRFVVEDWLTDSGGSIGAFDIVFSSNTLEHFHDPYQVLPAISRRARKGVVLALPYREIDRIDEHYFSFIPDNIRLVLDNGFRLAWAQVVDCRQLPNTGWSGEQIVLVYANPDWLDKLGLTLADMAVAHEDTETLLMDLQGLVNGRDKEIDELSQTLASRTAQIVELNQTVGERDRQLSGLKQALAERDGQLAERREAVIQRDRQIDELNRSVSEQHRRLAQVARTTEQVQRSLEQVLASRSWWLTKPFRFAARMVRHRGVSPDDRRVLLDKARGLYRATGLPEPIRRRLSGSLGRLVERPGILPPPPYGEGPVAAALAPPLPTAVDPDAQVSLDSRASPLKAFAHAATESAYRVLCLPVIDWDFRFQRPQQLMTQFAIAGHEVSYVALSFATSFSARVVADRVQEIRLTGPAGLNPYRDPLSEDLAQLAVDELVSRLALDAPCPLVCIVQLPFWAPLARLLRERIDCRIVYDCMDDHAGFSTNTAAMLEGERALIEQADLVVASSRLLAEKIRPSAKRSVLIQNACDFSHFQAVPARPIQSSQGLRIGYFGAIADWFDVDLVAELARSRPEWRIELVGSTFSADTAPLAALPNVALLGERPYVDLPALMRDWDCCIIPFLRCPLTDATNPVKVYEMLAAGKPVVAVALPELMPIAEQGLIRLASSAAEFRSAIEDSLSSDTADLAAARRGFAANNTWQSRFASLDQDVRALWPLASVVVVTFHNLELNKLCLVSLLEGTSYPNMEVIVVDNASEDGTPAWLQDLASRDKRVRAIFNKSNLGFAAANNQGIAVAQGAFLCLLNNDTVITPWWLTALIGHLQRNPELGLVGPVTNAIGNEAKIAVGYADLAEMPAWAAHYCASHRGQMRGIPMLAFFCVALPRGVFEQVGAIDERFGKGMFEDDDYCRRVRAAGFDIRCAHDSFVHHWQKASFNLLGNEEYLDIFSENRQQYLAKWGDVAADVGSGVAGPVTGGDVARMILASGKIGVVFAPSIGWGVHLFQRPHHLCIALAGLGHVVVFDGSNAEDPIEGFKEIAPRLFLYRGDSAVLRDLPNIVIWAFTYNWGYRDLFPPTVPVIYDWIDDLEVFPYDQALLRRLHERALREAAVVGCVAKVLLDEARQTRPDAIYLPNAVEYERFAAVSTLSPVTDDPVLTEFLERAGPLCGYYGALAEWFDYALLQEVASANPVWRFLLIGPDYDGSLKRLQLKRHRNICWAGPKDYKTLPGYLARFDVAMIPFLINDITKATSPLKLYEYFAGGKPVICTPMPECMAFPEVRIVRDATEFSAALAAARLESADVPLKERLRALARENSWVARAQAVLAVLPVGATTREPGAVTVGDGSTGGPGASVP